MSDASNEQAFDEQQPIRKYPIQQSAAFAGSTFALASLVDLFAHFGPTGLLVSGLASYVAWRHGPELYKYMQQQVKHALPVSAASELLETLKQENRQERRMLDRALGRFSDPSDIVKQWDEGWYPEEYDLEESKPPRMTSSILTFSQILEGGFVPSLSRMYL